MSVSINILGNILSDFSVRASLALIPVSHHQFEQDLIETLAASDQTIISLTLKVAV